MRRQCLKHIAAHLGPQLACCLQSAARGINQHIAGKVVMIVLARHDSQIGVQAAKRKSACNCRSAAPPQPSVNFGFHSCGNTRLSAATFGASHIRI